MNEFKIGWKIVLTSMLGIAFCGSNVLLYSIGALAPALSEEYGWSHGSIQFASLISISTVVLSLPVVVQLTARFGVRAVTLASMFLSSVFVSLHALLPSDIKYFYLFAFLTAVSYAGTLPITWTKMVTSWFDKRLGLALGLTLLGTGLGGALVKPIAAALIEGYGWRGAYIGLGIIPLIIVLPLIFAWFKEPASDIEQAGSKDGAADSGDAADNSAAAQRQFLKNWRFWVLAAAYLPIGFAVPGLITNMELILATGGASPEVVVTAASSFGLFVIVGRIVGGVLLDKFNPGIVGGVLILSLSVALLMLLQQDLTLSVALVAIALAGFGTGVEFDVLSYLVTRIFGHKQYVKVFGAVMGILYLSSAFGPMLFGATYDRYGNFDLVLYSTAVGVFVSALLIGSLAGTLRSPAVSSDGKISSALP
ncbi:MFS transporter [Spongiibacter sp. KMU-166]|uniref:MFS transporter n=1 Tax=Spongiibacter thalassae TaxID=2721624 RepID=A0ABX1GHP8_9GAMM|nr:MFS transporter [Spongiibacter thalassae]NKI18681.1 MFS transporter [Spongiibacter thalassae]